MSNSDDDVLRFIAASLPSVWALEVLLLLKREGVACDRAALVASLRASDVVVSKALDALVAAGVASIEGSNARYVAANRDLAECVDQVERLYRTRPNAVRRVIVAAGRGAAATAFADAFKLRRGPND